MNRFSGNRGPGFNGPTRAGFSGFGRMAQSKGSNEMAKKQAEMREAMMKKFRERMGQSRGGEIGPLPRQSSDKAPVRGRDAIKPSADSDRITVVVQVDKKTGVLLFKGKQEDVAKVRAMLTPKPAKAPVRWATPDRKAAPAQKSPGYSRSSSTPSATLRSNNSAPSRSRSSYGRRSADLGKSGSSEKSDKKKEPSRKSGDGSTAPQSQLWEFI